MSLDLGHAGLQEPGTIRRVHRNQGLATLIEHAVRAGDARLSAQGALVVHTGRYTGRSPDDKFTVLDDATRDTVWWGKHNKSTTGDVFEGLHRRIVEYLRGRDLYVEDCHAGAHPEHRLRVRVITEKPFHAAFAKNMFLAPTKAELAAFAPDFTVLHAPGFRADPKVDRTNSEAAILVDYTRRMVLLCGTSYAGEVKKSVFTVLNFLLPARGVLGMHCSANVAQEGKNAGKAAIFFGLSGTGKTTLSADPERSLVGDDEHGWADDGVFNFEGGCYAKVIKLDPEAEPVIWKTTRTFGTLLENVVMDEETRELDLDDGSLTENTRASYDISQVPGAVPEGRTGHPQDIVMLTADAYGVLPPLSRLTPEQAMYHFLSGYTARVAGTERGVTEPQATFSACFGAPFMARHPGVYAKLLGEKMAKHGARAWLVNTGWSGGPYGVGARMKIQWTRALLHAALDGKLDRARFVPHPVFGVAVPTEVPDVPSEVLDPRGTWPDPAAYDVQANRLAEMFRKNFDAFRDDVEPAIRSAEPRG